MNSSSTHKGIDPEPQDPFKLSEYLDSLNNLNTLS